MSDLSAAMEAAVASVDDRRRRRPATATAGATSARQGVRLRDEHDLPPVRARTRTTFTGTLREQFGPVAVAVWTGVRETVALVTLFWVSAVMLAFFQVEGAITIPGIGDATVITLSLVGAVVLRALLAAAGRTESAIESRRR